jgi:hypothetical protein
MQHAAKLKIGRRNDRDAKSAASLTAVLKVQPSLTSHCARKSSKKEAGADESTHTGLRLTWRHDASKPVSHDPRAMAGNPSVPFSRH